MSDGTGRTSRAAAGGGAMAAASGRRPGSSRLRNDGRRSLLIGVTALFLSLALALAALGVGYWVRVLEPRLQHEALSQAKILADSQAPQIVEALRAPLDLRRTRVADTLDRLLLLRDPETETPFFQSVALEIDYDLVDAQVGSLDLVRGTAEDEVAGARAEDLGAREGFIVEVPLTDVTTYELLGIARFVVSDRFFRQLAGDVRTELLGELGGALVLLFVAWGAVIILARTLERQTLERHRAERELWRHERKYERLVDSLSNYFVYRKDTLGRVTSVSDSVERVLGYLPEAAKARLSQGIGGLPPVEPDGRARDSQVELLDDAGSVHYVELSEVPLLDEQGAVVGADGIARDVTRQRLFQNELRHAKEQAEAASLAKSQFLANMSHEVRTPLNAILGMTTLALRTNLSPKQRGYLEKAKAAGRLLLELVEDILDLSKIEAGRLEIQQVTFDLDVLLSELADVVGMRVAESPVEILFSAAPDVPRLLCGDPTRLKQVILNLVGNAIKFTDDGEIVVEIEKLEERRDRVELRFSVTDTGIGIATEDVERLFEPFTQVDSSSTRRHGGVGLGLAISRHLVELMDGKLQVMSKVGEGSNFYFTAAFRVAEGAHDGVRLVGGRRGLRVLVADDNPTALGVLDRMLRSLACRVTAVSSGQEALDALLAAGAEHDPFAVALLDWKMPGIDGAETALRLRRLQELDQQPAVILVTAYGRDDVAQRAEHGGIEVVLHKPVSPSTLHDALVNALEPGQRAARSKERLVEGPTLTFATGQRVLLVEDNAINREVARELLGAAGLEVCEAVNGREAMGLLEKSLSGARLFDAVLMDVQMPEMDGVEAVAKIRSRKALRELPVIAMTAHAMLGDREEFLAAGMSDYISKPIEEEQLLATLARWLRVSGGETVARHERGESDRDEAASEDIGADADLPAELTGIDTADGLRRVAGNRKLYRRLLLDFSREAGAARRRLAQVLVGGPLESEDREAALTLLHTLKGTAGTLGAMRVADASASLERSLRTGLDRASGASDVSTNGALELERALDEVVASISVLRASGDPHRAADEQVAGSVPDLHAALLEVRRQLHDQDLAAARSFSRIKPLIPATLEPTASALERCLEELDYAAARTHFEALRSRLGVEGDEA